MRACLPFVLATGVSSCASRTEHGDTILAKEMRQWLQWAQGSHTDLWDEVPGKGLAFRLVRTIGGEAEDPSFYSIEAIAVAGDTIFVADQQVERLVALDSSGRLLWRAGRPGQGPGEFSGVSQIAVSDTLVAVSNLYNYRVDLFSRDGLWLRSFPARRPYDLTFLDDSTLVVVSHEEPGGLVTLFDLDGDRRASFGEWPLFSRNLGGNRDLHCARIGTRHLAVCSYYSTRIELYECDSGRLLRAFSRPLPGKIPEPESSEHTDGGVSFALSTVLLDIFEGPTGTIDVLLRPFCRDRSTDCPPKEIAPVSLVDRFSLEGRYKGSYVLPVRAGQCVYSGGMLFLADEDSPSIAQVRVTLDGGTSYERFDEPKEEPSNEATVKPEAPTEGTHSIVPWPESCDVSALVSGPRLRVHFSSIIPASEYGNRRPSQLACDSLGVVLTGFDAGSPRGLPAALDWDGRPLWRGFDAHLEEGRPPASGAGGILSDGRILVSCPDLRVRYHRRDSGAYDGEGILGGSLHMRMSERTQELGQKPPMVPASSFCASKTLLSFGWTHVTAHHCGIVASVYDHALRELLSIEPRLSHTERFASCRVACSENAVFLASVAGDVVGVDTRGQLAVCVRGGHSAKGDLIKPSREPGRTIVLPMVADIRFVEPDSLWILYGPGALPDSVEICLVTLSNMQAHRTRFPGMAASLAVCGNRIAVALVSEDVSPGSHMWAGEENRICMGTWHVAAE
ncbi:hypothetical protein JXA88_12915 [Candidatus Fermentibacteria bacterium]|nr:hypothetical protein [Candidatus Fermentibacteria bacterium]